MLWDRQTGKPVANAIVWQSRVSAPICDRLKADGLEPLIRRKTGLVIDAYFSGTKIKHLLDTSRACARAPSAASMLFGTIETFLIWRLTGGSVHVTDVSNASRTLLFDIHTLDWDDELLRHARRAAARCCPRCASSSEVYGETDADAASARRFRSPASPAISRRRSSARPASTPGTAKNTYGTGCFLLMNTGDDADAVRAAAC